MAAGEALGEDHQHLAAVLHALEDVVHDVLARDEVPLVDAQPQPQATLQRWEEMLQDPGQVLFSIRHEQIVSAGRVDGGAGRWGGGGGGG